jgi:predicted SAM-dependent methyltransferase
MIKSVRYNKLSIPLKVMEAVFFLRGLLFMGTRYTCPCCGWHIRAFNDGNAFLKKRSLSYCPRCNSKSRHRRIWLFLQNKTNLFTDTLSLFEVSPKFSFARRFTQMSKIQYLGADIYLRPYISLKMDLAATALKAESFDAVLCIHVLEEIIEDRRAMDEIYRILKPEGWAVVSVPTQIDQPTYEDTSITNPKERKRAFGEPDHVRVYGFDLADRLKESGFHVELDLAEDIPQQTREKYGLRGDENIFYCRKPKRMN